MGQRPAHYKDRLVTRIKEHVVEFFRQKCDQPELKLLSITKVEMSEDMGHTKIYWDTYNVEKVSQIESYLKELESRVRKHLSDKLEIRHTPTVKFIFDSQFIAENKITDLLRGKDS